MNFMIEICDFAKITYDMNFTNMNFEMVPSQMRVGVSLIKIHENRKAHGHKKC